MDLKFGMEVDQKYLHTDKILFVSEVLSYKTFAIA